MGVTGLPPARVKLVRTGAATGSDHGRTPGCSPHGRRHPARCTPADNPELARSLRFRFPPVDALNHLQVELLRRWRGGDHHELTKWGIRLTINGLATALRNRG